MCSACQTQEWSRLDGLCSLAVLEHGACERNPSFIGSEQTARDRRRQHCLRCSQPGAAAGACMQPAVAASEWPAEGCCSMSDRVRNGHAGNQSLGRSVGWLALISALT